jgi:hypothetical protein
VVGVHPARITLVTAAMTAMTRTLALALALVLVLDETTPQRSC